MITYRNWVWPLLAIWMLALLPVVPVVQNDAQALASSTPNVVLVMADDLGFECLRCNGGESYQTPRLDEMASQGMRYTRCFSQPLCTPSRVQIMTGRYNDRNYVKFGYLDVNETTFGHVMKSAGYATCVVGKWQLNGIGRREHWEDRERPRHFGFDQYCLWQLSKARDQGERYADPLIDTNGREVKVHKGAYGPDVVFDYAVDFLQRHKEGPFFLYYPMLLTHRPFVPTPDTEEWKRGDRDKNADMFFADMVEYTDGLVGRLLDKLEELGVAENTIVIFTADNGTPTGIKTQWQGQPYPGGKGNMWVPGTHVPLIVYWKGVVSPGSICGDLVDFSDVLPTLSEIAQAKLPAGIQLDGRSFLSRLKGEVGDPRTWIYCHYHPKEKDSRGRRYGRFAQNKQYKLYKNGKMYDVEKDWLEEHPIIGNTPSIELARRQLEKILTSRPDWTETTTDD